MERASLLQLSTVAFKGINTSPSSSSHGIAFFRKEIYHPPHRTRTHNVVNVFGKMGMVLFIQYCAIYTRVYNVQCTYISYVFLCTQANFVCYERAQCELYIYTYIYERNDINATTTKTNNHFRSTNKGNCIYLGTYIYYTPYTMCICTIFMRIYGLCTLYFISMFCLSRAMA